MQFGCVSVSLFSPLSLAESTAVSLSNALPCDADTSCTRHDDFSNLQRCESNVAQLIVKQASLGQWLKMFVEESAVRRGDIVSKFGSMRAVLDSVERAALVAYDGEVRRVVKCVELECEGVEVLSQQLSGHVLAFGDGWCGTVDDGCESADSITESVRSVDVVLCGDGLCEVLKGCWSLVRVSGEDADGQAMAVGKVEVRICDQVSKDVVPIVC
jgi:hypothetical protein